MSNIRSFLIINSPSSQQIYDYRPWCNHCHEEYIHHFKCEFGDLHLCCLPSIQTAAYLVNNIEDVKENPKAVQGNDLSHQVVLSALPAKFEFGPGLGSMGNGVGGLHSPLIWVVLERQLMSDWGMEPGSNWAEWNNTKWKSSHHSQLVFRN